jgi:hypothetical protein
MANFWRERRRYWAHAARFAGRRGSASLWTVAGGRDDASTPSGAARWEPHGAAPPLLRWGSGRPFAPSSVLARSGLSAPSPAGAASVGEFSRSAAPVPASGFSFSGSLSTLFPLEAPGESLERRPPRPGARQTTRAGAGAGPKSEPAWQRVRRRTGPRPGPRAGPCCCQRRWCRLAREDCPMLRGHTDLFRTLWQESQNRICGNE